MGRWRFVFRKEERKNKNWFKNKSVNIKRRTIQMRNFIAGVFIIVIVIGIVIGIVYGSWQLKRWFNWKYMYGDQVAEAIAPLEKRIAELEKRVEKLESKK
jgi:predicted PurR-regulated permease PerM